MVSMRLSRWRSPTPSSQVITQYPAQLRTNVDSTSELRPKGPAARREDRRCEQTCLEKDACVGLGLGWSGVAWGGGPWGEGGGLDGGLRGGA